jgi:AcrR family transcriptional regulator
MRTQDMSAERVRDAEWTRAEILEVATAEFADRMRTTKCMIDHHFGGKQQLYIAVLERAYVQLREAQQTLDVDH